jgi:hypothetical protein
MDLLEQVYIIFLDGFPTGNGLYDDPNMPCPKSGAMFSFNAIYKHALEKE